MRKKGFTLIELLVVISIIAMLLAILMPALNKVKKIAMRVVCGTNLKGMGTAQMVYAHDYDDQYTVQGGGRARSLSYQTDNWQNPRFSWRDQATANTNITIGASLYLLVREADVGTKSFICPAGDEQQYDGENTNSVDMPDLVELWDFGHIGDLGDTSGPANHVSYSYHMPYAGTMGTTTGARGPYAASGTQSASFALMADKNPSFDDKLTNSQGDADNYTANAWYVNNQYSPGKTVGWDSIERWSLQIANTRSHDREGQNILFGDGSTSFENRPDVAQRNDNIYTPWGAQTNPTEGEVRCGTIEGSSDAFVPRSGEDSVLVNDLKNSGTKAFPNIPQ